jgi:hypothetical protein
MINRREAIIRLVGHDKSRSYYVLPYATGCLEHLPWGSERFDCILCSCDATAVREAARDLAPAVARARTDWVQTTGALAEWLHDEVDRASVEVGRQSAVGDGSPMTSWNQKAVALATMAEVVVNCFGGCDQVLAVVIGGDVTAIGNEIEQRLIAHQA